MQKIKFIYCFLVMKLIRPFIYFELPGWGKVYNIFVGNYKRNNLWSSMGSFWTVGKIHNYWMIFNMGEWADRVAYFLGRWIDLPTQLFLLTYLKSGDIVIDIGANKGMMSLVSSRLVGASGRVIAFEPNPEPREIFEKNLSKNKIGNIEIWAAGLSNEEGELTLHVPHISSGEATFGHTRYASSETYSITCPVHIGDNVLADITPILIKIDVEGFEQYVLEGLVNIIENGSPVIITEVVEMHLINAQSSVSNIFDFFTSQGYDGFKLCLKGKKRKKILAISKIELCKEFPDMDIVWVKRDNIRHQEFMKSVAIVS